MNSKKRVGIGSIAVFAVLLIGGGFAMAGSGTPQPANVNPNKAPAQSSSNIKPEFAAPLSVQQEVEQSKTWASQEPNTRLVCFRTDGSVAGMSILELVDPASPLSATGTAEFCNRTIPEPPQSLEDQLAAAKAHVIATANDSGVIVCLTTVGTLAGDIMVDRPVGAKPFTTKEKQLACEQGFKGSHS